MGTIAITGGKGGTGKTTVALTLAFKAIKKGKKVVLVDADIETPNIYSFLGKGEKRGSLNQQYPEIDHDACIRCGLCVNKCPNNALFMTERISLVENMCEGCSVCKHVCPVNAIRMVNKEVGEIYIKEGNPLLVYGILTKYVEETGHLVEQLLDFSNQSKADVKIIDTAAGTHCNVIKALAHADKVIVVTEPTPLGFHDLNVIVNLVKEIGKPFSIVINKSMNNKVREDITKFAEKEGVSIEMEIPYNEEIAKSYAEGKLWIEY